MVSIYKSGPIYNIFLQELKPTENSKSYITADLI